MKRALIGITCVVSALGMQGCLETESYPVEPAILSTNLTVMTDSLLVEVEFTDGDGDIGFMEEDTAGFNLLVEYYEWNFNSGEWEQGVNLLGEPIAFNARIPNITPTGRNKSLKGLIRETIEPPYFNPLSVYSDTIKYRVKLIDRALRESSWEWTPEIWNGVVQ